jgi:hypothetical protein
VRVNAARFVFPEGKKEAMGRRYAPLEESGIGIPFTAANLLTFDWSTLTLCPIEEREVIHAKEKDGHVAGHARSVNPADAEAGRA